MTMCRETLWNGLDSDIYNRLCDCRSLKADILPLAKCIHKNKGYDAEQSLVYVLEHLECNSQDFDLTKEEFEDLMQQIA